MLIIKKGRIIADGKPEGLVQDLKGGEKLRIEAACPLAVQKGALEAFPGGVNLLEATEEGGRSTVLIDPKPDRAYNERLLRHLVERGVPVNQFVIRRFTLEEVFIHLTVEDEVLSGLKEVGSEAS